MFFMARIFKFKPKTYLVLHLFVLLYHTDFEKPEENTDKSIQRTRYDTNLHSCQLVECQIH